MHHLLLALSVPHTVQENCRLLRSRYWQRSSTLRKNKEGKKKKPPRRNDSRYWRDGGRIKWAQFQRGNNGGHGVWCSYAGHENDSVDDGINHTSVAQNVNEDVFACSLAFLITMLASNQPCIRPDGGEQTYLQPRWMISADGSNHIWNVFVVLFCASSFSCVFVVMSGRKVKMEFILWYRLPVQTREMLTQGDITLVSALRVPLHLSFPAS